MQSKDSRSDENVCFQLYAFLVPMYTWNLGQIHEDKIRALKVWVVFEVVVFDYEGIEDTSILRWTNLTLFWQ